MYYERNNYSRDCSDCIDKPSDVSCNIFCDSTSKNCYESYKVFNPNLYAKAYIVLQPYEHLFNLDDAFDSGTIFRDLYSPYCAEEYIKR